MTLIELLIVMGILLVMVTLGAVNIQPEVERRRMREAARQVSVYIGSARSRALETGRPCGVMIERFMRIEGGVPVGDPRIGMILHQVEVPPPYAGADIGSKCIVQIIDPPPPGKPSKPLDWATLNVQFFSPSGYSPTFDSPVDANLVQAGDQIQFNGQGPMYTVTNVDNPNGKWLTAELDLSKGQWIPWTTSWSLPMPYKILRQPQKSGAAPLQLPATVVIDLQRSGPEVPSGTDTGAFELPGSGPDFTVKVMFSGSGTLEGYYTQMTPAPGILPVYLLVGKRQRVLSGGVTPEDNLYNYQDFDNYWIAITPQGLVATDQVGVNAANATNIPADLYESRQFVRGGRSKGGG